MYANSSLFLEKVIENKDDSKTYSLRINYKCNEDASKLV